MTETATHPLLDGRTDHSALIRALRGERPERTPVWFLGQAGPSLPEHELLTAGRSSLECSLHPAVVSALTVQPVERYGVDAAVYAGDPLVALRLAGIEIDLVDGQPVIAQPVRTALDVIHLRPIDPAVLDPIRVGAALAAERLGSTPLIALAIAPYTLASHLVEGGPSIDQAHTRALMVRDPQTWASLLNWCADVTGQYLRAQLEHGASAGILIDPFVGSLSRKDYFKRVAPHTQRAISHARGLPMPIIHFGLGTGEFLDVLGAVGVSAIGVDWRVPLDTAIERTERLLPVQGNIDPAFLTAPWRLLRAHLADILERGAGAPAHIVSLGDTLPATADPEVLARIVQYIHGELPEE